MLFRSGDLATVGPEQAPFAASWTRLPGRVEHVFTHFTLRLALFGADAPPDAPEGHVFVAPDEIEGAGFSGLMRKAIALARG